MGLPCARIWKYPQPERFEACSLGKNSLGSRGPFDLAPMDPDGERQGMKNQGPMIPPLMVTRLLLFLVVLVLFRSLAGEQATAVAALTAGFVTGITVTFGGSGYSSEPAVTISGGGGTGAAAKAFLNGDKVASVIVLNAGIG